MNKDLLFSFTINIIVDERNENTIVHSIVEVNFMYKSYCLLPQKGYVNISIFNPSISRLYLYHIYNRFVLLNIWSPNRKSSFRVLPVQTFNSRSDQTFIQHASSVFLNTFLSILCNSNNIHIYNSSHRYIQTKDIFCTCVVTRPEIVFYAHLINSHIR